MKDPNEKVEEEEEPRRNWLRRVAAVLVFALVAVVGVDGYFNDWSIFRTLAALNTLELRDRSDQPWRLTSRKDFQLVDVKDVRTIVDTDSLLAFDQSYRQAGYYRLYFRTSDSSSTKLQKMYQAILSMDTAKSIQHTVNDARRAYENLQTILRLRRSAATDTARIVRPDSARLMQNDMTQSSGDEAMAVLKKIASDPHVLTGLGIGLVASAGIDLLRGDAYLAVSKEDVFRLDSIKVGSRVGTWEGRPIDIVWVFGKEEKK